MRVIYRYEIDLDAAAKDEGYFSLELPLGSEPLHVAVQERAPHAPSLWALVDPERPPIKRKFLLAGTGTEHKDFFGSKWNRYIGTFQQHGFVWHVWEVSS